MLKKSLAVTLTLVMGLAFTGCSSENYRKGKAKVDSSRVMKLLEEIITEPVAEETVEDTSKKATAEENKTDSNKDLTANDALDNDANNAADTETDSDTAEQKPEDDKSSEKQQTVKRITDDLNLEIFKILANDKATAVYFAEGPNKGMGAVNSIFAINDPAVFGLDFESIDQVTEVMIFLLNGRIDTQSALSLLVKGKKSDGKEFAFVADSLNQVKSDGRITINFTLGDRILQAVTTDFGANGLNAAIQLKLFTRDLSGGEPVFEGKLSSLKLVR
jgi:hypothetical protein